MGVSIRATASPANLENGARSTTSSSAIALSSTSIPCQGVIVKADAANPGSLFVGKSDVTVSGTEATDGYELAPGESTGVPCRNVNEVFIRAAATGYRAMWLAALN